MLELVKQLRQTTNAPVALCREAAQYANGDVEQARAYIDKHWSLPKPKAAGAGQIFTYVHQGRVGVMVDLRCTTDFVARTSQFQMLCKEVALQVAAGIEEGADLLQQRYIRDPQRTLQDLVDQISRQTGEAICIKRTLRWSLDE